MTDSRTMVFSKNGVNVSVLESRPRPLNYVMPALRPLVLKLRPHGSGATTLDFQSPCASATDDVLSVHV
jgi:hypothetical protein